MEKRQRSNPDEGIPAAFQTRPARLEDLAALHRIRLAVRENQLTRTVIHESDYAREIEETGRGWVVEEDAMILGFAVANRETGGIWALFVDPEHEGRGIGSRLHDEMLSWLWDQGLEELWLFTDPGTRAESFYRARGWKEAGRNEHGEIRFERSKD